MLGARLVARWSEDYAGYIGTGQQVSTARGVDVTLARLAPLIRDRGRADHLDWLATATPEGLWEHATYVDMMQMLDGYHSDMNVPTWRLAAMLLRAPEYNLADLKRWLNGANRGSGLMWTDYRSRDLLTEVPQMPVPMLLISGAKDLNTPIELTADWFQAVEAPKGKRHLVFAQSGHAPFLIEPAHFIESLRTFATNLRNE
jgi:pimeloyl-ACP methyl ester carboxylesterase